MPLLKSFTSRDNLERAFHRVIRGSNKDYKQFFRHLYPSYNQALSENLLAIRERLSAGSFQPTKPTIVYQPKKTGILRPLTLLTLEDQIVYQALANTIADRMRAEQDKLALKRRFGALYAGKRSYFFFRSWKRSYRAYNNAITAAFNAGKTWVADFDLVSCYELIDHNLLRACLEDKVRSPELLDLLFECLKSWTTNSSGSHLRHGLPQGPEASAFLAECLLFRFDSLRLKEVVYLRYIDDIRLMAKDEIPLRRALLKLDLSSKDAGLVPQAQKITIRQVQSAQDIIKSIPSSIAGAALSTAVTKQSDLRKMFWHSLAKRHKQWHVINQTHFRYAVHRLRPRLDVLSRCGKMLVARPDLAGSFATYFKRFPNNKLASDLLLEALRRDPTYDFAAAAYIEAMDVCEPAKKNTAYRRVIQTANRRSEEKSIWVRIASICFRCRRRGPADAVRLIEAERDPAVRCIVLARLFGDHDQATFKATHCAALLEKETCGTDGDLARFAASVLIELAAASGTTWKAKSKAHDSVKRLLVGLGLRRKGPKRITVLETFFERQGVIAPMPWRKALGKDFADLERRCLRVQRLAIGDPTAYILMLDTFNEALVQAFSRTHPSLASPYKAAAGANAHPDIGNWLRNPQLQTALPTASTWFLDVHEARVRADMAHAKAKKGAVSGKPTKPISSQERDAYLKDAKTGWTELIHRWRAFI